MGGDILPSPHTSVTYWFGSHQPNFARKALQRHRRGCGCHACVENQGVCSQRLDDASFSILVICNHLVHFKRESFFSSSLRKITRLDEKQRGVLHLFNNDLSPGFFFLSRWEENFYFKRETGFLICSHDS